MNKTVTLLLLAAIGCSSGSVGESLEPRHERALEAIGIKGAVWAPYNWFVCGKDDNILASTGFVAGEVSGNVCCGLLLKGCVVRTQ